MSMILKTSQVKHLKGVFDTIKEVIQDVNIHFIGDSEPDAGILIACMDNSNQSLVHFMMSKTELDTAGIYKCSIPCKAGINIPNFYKILKTVKDSDTLTIQMKSDDREKLFIGCDNDEKKKRGEYSYNLMDNDESELVIPDEDFNSVITLDPSEFQQMCRDLNCLETDRVKITSTGREFIMSASGDNARGSFSLGQRNEEGKGEVICNEYPLKFLICFAKAARLSNTLIIRLKPNFPIILDYQIPSLGLLRFCLSPILQPPSDDDDPDAETRRIEDETRRIGNETRRIENEAARCDGNETRTRPASKKKRKREHRITPEVPNVTASAERRDRRIITKPPPPLKK